MDNVVVIHDPDPDHLQELGVFDWPIWSKETSEFPWEYKSSETCYILEGKVTVTPDNGKPIAIEEKDLVTFPEGMSCTWKITQDVRKHYTFD